MCTNRLDYITRFVSELQVGTVNIREVPGYRLELTPFGGIKDSGLGYKEGVQEAMKSFTNVRRIRCRGNATRRRCLDARSLPSICWPACRCSSGARTSCAPASCACTAATCAACCGAACRKRGSAFFAGLGVTGLIQSSTATALIVASFAGQGLIGTAPALAVMLGADVGTALVTVLLSFDLSWLAPLLIFSGVVLFLSRQADAPSAASAAS